MTKDIQNATINILVELDGDLYMTQMEKETLEFVSSIIKNATSAIVKTNLKQSDLNQFLGISHET